MQLWDYGSKDVFKLEKHNKLQSCQDFHGILSRHRNDDLFGFPLKNINTIISNQDS